MIFDFATIKEAYNTAWFEALSHLWPYWPRSPIPEQIEALIPRYMGPREKALVMEKRDIPRAADTLLAQLLRTPWVGRYPPETICLFEPDPGFSLPSIIGSEWEPSQSPVGRTRVFRTIPWIMRFEAHPVKGLAYSPAEIVLGVSFQEVGP